MNARAQHTILVLVALHVMSWALPLRSSFWLDECGSAWVVLGGWGELFPRTLRLLQAPLPALIWLCASTVGGVHEAVLRLPSFVGTVGAVVLLYRWADEFFGPDTASVTLVFVVANPLVAFAASDARPYGLALLLCVASYWSCMRAIRAGRMREILIFAVASALLCHFHLLFVYQLGGLAIAVLSASPRSVLRASRAWLAGIGVLLFLLVPLLRHYFAMLTLQNVLTFLRAPTVGDVVEYIVPAFPHLHVFVAVAIGLIVARRAEIEFSGHRREIAVITILALFPVSLLYLMSAYTDTKLFLDRYLLPSAAPLALLWGWGCGAIGPAKVRAIACIFALSTTLVARLADRPFEHHPEDWRGAISLGKRTAAPDALWIIYPGFIESSSLDIVRREDAGYLRAPLAVYAADVGRSLVLPYSATPEARRYVEAALGEQRTRKPGRDCAVVFVARGLVPEWTVLLRSDLARHGCKVALDETAAFGRVRLMTFQSSESLRY